MSSSTQESKANPARIDQLFHGHLDANYRATSRIFGVLMVAQWAFGIFIALTLSPYAWEGKVHTIHTHVYAALILGGVISGLPLFLLRQAPAAPSTRYVVAVAQILWSALLIHLTGGRIETHFHVFVSLAFLAFYRDWKVLLIATVVVAADHLTRGILWPESVYGVANPEWWRFLEHAFWVVFEDTVLIISCVRGVHEMMNMAKQQAETEALSESERTKSLALSQALDELKNSHEAMSRIEKLAAVGQLAASVGHELRNPLAAIRNAQTYIARRLFDGDAPPVLDPKVKVFSDVIDRELKASARIIDSLLDFARARPLNPAPCPLRALVDEAIGLVPPSESVKIGNAVPADLPIPPLDKDQFRQILINLVQNASEAMPPGKAGVVTVSAEGGDTKPWLITVADDGVGIPKDALEKIFQPLFTTKTKGTGLGLAVVQGVVERHKGAIRVESEPGKGTRFLISLPATVPASQAA